jgi:quercetin dioxygenase-like cupin family protein
MKKIALEISLLLAGFSLTAKAQHSDPTKTITQSPLAVVFSKTLKTDKIDNQEIRLVLVKFAPGEISGAHRHPIPAIAYVLEGEIESTFDGKVKRFKKGESFYEDPNLLHAATKNMSKTKPAALLVYFIGDPKKPFITTDHK